MDLNSTIQTYSSEENLKQFHEFHAGYYSYGNIEEPSQTRNEFLKALDFLSSSFPEKKSLSIFDVGYGNGFFLALAQKKGWFVDGIDSSEINQKNANNRFGLNLKVGNFDQNLEEDQKYDVVSFWDVIEHLPQPDFFLDKARTLLKPSGKILIAVPNDKSLMAILAHIINKASCHLIDFPLHKLYLLEHVSYFQKKSLLTLLERKGFKLHNFFYSSTDLNKYTIPLFDKIVSGTLLFLGKVIGYQNRLICIFKLES